MNITLEQFKKIMIFKVNELVAVNSSKEKPWTRTDFLRYIRGACDLFFFEHYTEDTEDDLPSVLADIYCDSDCYEVFKEN